MAGERLATTHDTAEPEHDGTHHGPGRTANPITGVAQFELGLKFHLCGDNPIYKLSERQRSRVLDSLIAQLIALTPQGVLDEWNKFDDLPKSPDNHHYEYAQIQEFMNRRIRLLTREARREGQADVLYGTAIQCNPGQCCQPMGTLHRSCFGLWVTRDHQLLNLIDDDSGGLTEPIEAQVLLELTITTPLHTHGGEEIDEAISTSELTPPAPGAAARITAKPDRTRAAVPDAKTTKPKTEAPK